MPFPSPAPCQIDNLQMISPFDGLLFHFVAGFLCSAEAFHFDVVPFVYFCVCYFAFGVRLKDQCQGWYEVVIAYES